MPDSKPILERERPWFRPSPRTQVLTGPPRSKDAYNTGRRADDGAARVAAAPHRRCAGTDSREANAALAQPLHDLGAHGQKRDSHGSPEPEVADAEAGDFRDFAYATLADGSRPVLLDGKENVAASPDENLVREFIELSVVGHGNGYTEADVKKGAGR